MSHDNSHKVCSSLFLSFKLQAHTFRSNRSNKMATSSGVKKRTSGRNVTRVTASGLDALIGLLSSDEPAAQTTNAPPDPVDLTPAIKQEPSDSDDTNIDFQDDGYEESIDVKHEPADFDNIKADIPMGDPGDRINIKQEPLDSEDTDSTVAMSDHVLEHIEQKSRASIDTAHGLLPTEIEEMDHLEVPGRVHSVPDPDSNIRSAAKGAPGQPKESSGNIKEYDIRMMAKKTCKAT